MAIELEKNIHPSKFIRYDLCRTKLAMDRFSVKRLFEKLFLTPVIGMNPPKFPLKRGTGS
jgi:hypothetical protein